MTEWYPSYRAWVNRGLAVWFGLNEIGYAADAMEWPW